MKLDATVTISVILALCAVVAPVLTALINNQYQIRLRELELKEKESERQIYHKREIIENYIKCVGKCVAFSDGAAIKEYEEAYLLVYFYLPKDVWGTLENIDFLIEREDWEEARKWLVSAIPSIVSSAGL